MTGDTVDIQSLDVIFNSMVRTMDQSKNDIFIISEQSRESFESMKNEVDVVRGQIAQAITEGDHLEEMTRHSRKRLANVSKNFMNYSETQVREAYEVANDLLVRLSVSRLEEKQLRERRDDLDRRLAGLLDTIERADQLINQVAVVMNYLTTDLKDVGEALTNAKNKHDFSIRIIQAQEEERKRLSRDIHDGPAQMLANVLLRAGLIEKTYNERGPGQALAELSELKETVKSALLEVRRIIYDLRPMALDDLGLIPTLKKYLSKINEFEKDKEIQFRNSGLEQRFHTDFEVAIFRLVQESVSNALKHGNSKDIWVKIEWLHDIINIMIKDNGKGFNPDEVRDKSFGLIGMRERVDLLKGEMKIQSTPGNGTSILFKIPLKDEKIIESN
ncbi:sensor histidine kinase [Sporosarcina sp. FA9]|uniref:sensor histidine kinase n=1 Tax=Sporosarcina sp. FA9 TaxID=3413030 RepID=UPI003F65D554